MPCKAIIQTPPPRCRTHDNSLNLMYCLATTSNPCRNALAYILFTEGVLAAVAALALTDDFSSKQSLHSVAYMTGRCLGGKTALLA